MAKPKTDTASEFPARQAEPDQEFTWHDATGAAQHMTADHAGIVRPDSREAEEVADSFGLPRVAETKED